MDELDIIVGAGGAPARNTGSGPIDRGAESAEIERRMAVAEELRARADMYMGIADELTGDESAAMYQARAAYDDEERAEGDMGAPTPSRRPKGQGARQRAKRATPRRR